MVWERCGNGVGAAWETMGGRCGSGVAAVCEWMDMEGLQGQVWDGQQRLGEGVCVADYHRKLPSQAQLSGKSTSTSG